MDGLTPLDSFPQTCSACGTSFEINISYEEPFVKCPICGDETEVRSLRAWLLEAQTMYEECINLVPDKLLFRRALAGVEKRLKETPE